MTEPLDFTGRIALITGAGQGIGLAYAQLLAARGAKVVVNDLGTATGGGGADTSRAQAAVEAIVAAGGTAEPDSSDISTSDGAAAAVQKAVEAFGGLDILISNAGIFALDAFPEIELELMQRMFDVHIAGTFNVTRAAWPHLTASGSGRVVLTTSTSALGAADTVAYGTAKAGVIGMGRALAQVGEPHDIKVNMIAPHAMTRMMSTGMGLRDGESLPNLIDFGPELVAPLVAVLCHESCPVTGEVYIAGMRRGARLFIAETAGYTHPGIDLTAEDIVEHWSEVDDEPQLRPIPTVQEFSRREERKRKAVWSGNRSVR
jgi:NAD(P)-dependent dehydrogenase (short-subunit alcohol dehydrogenase family)